MPEEYIDPALPFPVGTGCCTAIGSHPSLGAYMHVQARQVQIQARKERESTLMQGTPPGTRLMGSEVSMLKMLR